ncbi:unnamed protein product [Dicrocoelium dendriticum]|nr:unnamed protein product [Dicrocoelium dendriticum]
MYMRSVAENYVRIRRCCSLRLILVSAVILTGELLPVLLTWVRFSPLSPRSPDEVRLLLASDPHVQLSNSIFALTHRLALFDSDSFLRIFFLLFLKYSDPNGIVLLGDLTDGGSSVSEWSFSDAVRRIKHIFISSHHIPCLVVPGDNDIGGEGNDFISDERVLRFQKAFVGFTEVNDFGFLKLYGHSPWSHSTDVRPESKNTTLIAYVSHTSMVAPFINGVPEVLSHLRPSLLLSGHDHLAYALRWKRSPNSTVQFKWLVPPDGLQLFSTPFETYLGSGLSDGGFGSVIQLGVPSCSYRSGEPHLAAYGLLQVYRNRSMRYTLAPLPHRFHILLLYSFVFLTLCLYTLFKLSPTAFVRRFLLDAVLALLFYFSCHLVLFNFLYMI